MDMVTKTPMSSSSDLRLRCYKGGDCKGLVCKVFDELPKSDWRSPSRILEVSIHHVRFAIDEFVLRRVFGRFGVVESVSVCHGFDHVEARVVFQSKHEAAEAYGELHGLNIFYGCCQMEIKWGLFQEHGVPVVTQCSSLFGSTTSAPLFSSSTTSSPAPAATMPTAPFSATPTTSPAPRPSLKYQLPQDDLDSLISITSDDDVVYCSRLPTRVPPRSSATGAPFGAARHSPSPTRTSSRESSGATASHADFCSEVSAVACLSDSALVVVDAVKGVRVQTHTALRLAFGECLRPCLVLIKLDRLLTNRPWLLGHKQPIPKGLYEPNEKRLDVLSTCGYIPKLGHPILNLASPTMPTTVRSAPFTNLPPTKCSMQVSNSKSSSSLLDTLPIAPAGILSTPTAALPPMPAQARVKEAVSSTMSTYITISSSAYSIDVLSCSAFEKHAAQKVFDRLLAQNTLHLAIFGDRVQLRPLPWPSFSGYAAPLLLKISGSAVTPWVSFWWIHIAAILQVVGQRFGIVTCSILPQLPWMSFDPDPLFKLERHYSSNCDSLQHALLLLLDNGNIIQRTPWSLSAPGSLTCAHTGTTEHQKLECIMVMSVYIGCSELPTYGACELGFPNTSVTPCYIIPNGASAVMSTPLFDFELLVVSELLTARIITGDFLHLSGWIANGLLLQESKIVEVKKIGVVALWNGNLTSVLVLNIHLAAICLLRAGLNWSTTCCIVLQPWPPPAIHHVNINSELAVTCLVASKLTVLDWMLMAEIQLELVCDGAKLRPTPWPSFSSKYHQVAAEFSKQGTCADFSYMNVNFVHTTISVFASVGAMSVDHHITPDSQYRHLWKLVYESKAVSVDSDQRLGGKPLFKEGGMSGSGQATAQRGLGPCRSSRFSVHSGDHAALGEASIIQKQKLRLLLLPQSPILYP